MHKMREAWRKAAAYRAPEWVRYTVCVACIGFILLALLGAYHAPYGFTDMLRYGSAFEPNVPLEVKQVRRRIFSGPGYDGQFYADLAIDPTLRQKNKRAFMDLPQYRSRRIFLPLCAYLAGRGNPSLTLNAYGVCNFFFWIGLVVLVFMRMRPSRIQEYACALAIVFSAGVTGSVLYALTDMPALVLLFTALLCPVIWPLALSAAVLTRETTIMFAPVFFIMEKLKNGSVMPGALKVCAALLPPMLWYAYCMKRIPEPVVMQHIFGFPFLAMLHRLASIMHHFPQTLYREQLMFFPVAASLTTQMCFFFARRNFTDPLWLAGATGAVFIALMGYGPWMDYGWVLRYSLPMTFAFNFLLAKQCPRVFIAWFIPGNLGCMMSPSSFPW